MTRLLTPVTALKSRPPAATVACTTRLLAGTAVLVRQLSAVTARVAGIAILCLTLCLTQGAWAGAPTDDASREAGKKLFKARCSSCHGVEGKGDGPVGKSLKPPPRNLQSDALKNGDGDEQIFDTISNGLKGTVMVGYASQISEADRWKLVAFIRGLRKK